MQDGYATLAVLALAVLAGCGGMAGDGTPEPATPAPVPTVEPPLAPGVTEAAIDGERLLDRHQQALENRSLTTHSRYLTGVGGGDERTVRRVVATTDQDGRYAYERSEPLRNESGLINRTEMWWDGNTTTYRYTYGSGDTDRLTVQQRSDVDLGRIFVLSRLLSGLDTNRVNGLPGGGAELSGRLTEESTVPTTSAIESPRNASATLRIRDDGLIERTAVAYDARYGGNRTDVRVTIRFEAVGRTTVERPAWLDE